MAFEHLPLKHADSIRLLILHPSAILEADLHAELIEVRLEEKPTFEAISYTWGEPLFSHQLHLAEQTFDITGNLADALCCFRQVDSPRALWADQICINQKNIKEKGHQVGMMSNIYKGAERVLIWLGAESPNTKLAVEFYETLSSSHGYEVLHENMTLNWWRTPPTFKDKTVGASQILENAKNSHVEDIYSREWFRRLWIIQEVVLARRAELHCGQLNLKWWTFASALARIEAALAVDHTELACPEGFESARIIIDINQHHGDINEIQPSLIVNKYEHFGAYMHKARKQKCSDDRDRVFALSGLKPFYYDILAATERNEHSFQTIEVDYEKPAFLVFREWALDLMDTGDFNFILDAGIWQRDVHIWCDGMEFINGVGSWQKGLWISTEEEGDKQEEAAENPKRTRNGFVISNIRGETYMEGETAPPAKMSIIPPPSELPSWVPDLSNLGDKPYSLPWINPHGMWGFKCRSDAGQGGLQSVKWGNGEESIPKKIWVNAVQLGKIGSRLAIHEWDESQPDSRVFYMQKILISISVLFEHQLLKSPWPIDEEKDIALARTVFADGSGTRCQTYLRANNMVPAEGPDGSKLVADPDRLHEMWVVFPLLWEEFRKEGEFGVPLEDLPSKTKEIWDCLVSIYFCLAESLGGHNFFITENGFIGLAPLVAKQGDVIALIDSIRTPVALRSVTAHDLKGYIVIGPCYTHGVMYGETLPHSGSPLAQEGEYLPLI